MRFVMKVSWDVEAGNALARQGKLASTVQSILADTKPEAAYFMAEDGKRGGILIVDITEASQIPALAEPWFLAANAKVELFPVMRPEDLARRDRASRRRLRNMADRTAATESGRIPCSVPG